MNSSVHQPIITVILAVYNGGAYLKQAVRSVLEQSMPHFEFLILDDQSSDGSYEWLQEMQDNRIHLFRNDVNKGLFYNLNFLINKSASSLVKLWSQDDIMYPHCLQTFVDFHHDYPQIGFSYSERDIIDEKGIIKENNVMDHTPNIVSTELHARIAYFTGSIAGNIANVCINKMALNKVGLFKEHMKISADFDMWVRLAEHYDTGFIREKLIQLRDHEGQLSRNEKYYINHVREDLEVYKYLNNYVSNSLKQEGEALMRIKKLPFYYTLMLKAFFKKEMSSGVAYFKLLNGYTNLFSLSAHYFKIKIFKKRVPEFFPHKS